MKTLSLIFNQEGWEPVGDDKDKSIQEITELVIGNIIHNFSQQRGGMLKADRNLFYSINDKIEKAVKEKAESVELDDKEVGFLRKCVNEAKLPPGNLLRRIEDLIEAIPNR